MRVYGNLMNRIEESGRQPEPYVGQGATILHFSDREAGTVIKVAAAKGNATVITVQTDKATRIDANGMSESQEYRYEGDPAGALTYFRIEKDGRYAQVHWNPKTLRWNKARGGGHGLRLGHRNKYHDFSF